MRKIQCECKLYDITKNNRQFVKRSFRHILLCDSLFPESLVPFQIILNQVMERTSVIIVFNIFLNSWNQQIHNPRNGKLSWKCKSRILIFLHTIDFPRRYYSRNLSSLLTTVRKSSGNAYLFDECTY